MAMTQMTIGEAAQRAGVGVETIRFYERKKLIAQPPKPAGGGYRSYPQETVDRIRFVRQAQELGFSLREIVDLLSLRADPLADSADVRTRALGKLEEIDRKIGQLKHMRAALKTVIAACPGQGAVECCSILEAMSRTQTKT